MKKILVAAFSAFALSVVAACGGASASSAAGTYELDKASFKQAMVASGLDSATADKAVGAMSMAIELKADGTAAMTAKGMGNDEPAAGTWKLDGSKLTITTKDPKSGKGESKTVDYADGTFTIDMGPDAPAKMVFRRK